MTSDLTEAQSEARPDDERYWAAARQQMTIEPGTLHFNTGTCGPVPLPVQHAAKHLRDRLAASPSDWCWRQLTVRLPRARRRLAEYLNVDAADLLLIANATIGMNIVVRSLDFPAGSRILTTDHEYGAMRMLLERTCKERGWILDTVTLPFPTEDPGELVDAVTAACGTKTAALFLYHVASPTGLVLPLEPICAFARERGLRTIIDGAHAIGMVPLDLTALDADYYSSNCHKWLLAPLGSAFLHVRHEQRAELQPLVTSWGWEDGAFAGHDLDADTGWGGSYWHRNLEFHGTIDRTGQLVLPETLDFRASVGDAAAIARQKHLAAALRAKLAALGLEPATPANPALAGSLVAFRIPPVDPVRTRDYFWHRYRLEAPATQTVGRFYWRFSTAWFNSAAELAEVADIAASVHWRSLA